MEIHGDVYEYEEEYRGSGFGRKREEANAYWLSTADRCCLWGHIWEWERRMNGSKGIGYGIIEA